MLKNRNLLMIFFKSKTDQSRSISSSSSPVPTNDQISSLILDQKSPSQALHTFKWASQLPHFTHTQSTYRALIHRLCTFRCFDTVHQLLDEMPNSIGSPPDDDIFITIVRGLGKARMVRHVIKVLDLVSKFKVTPTLKLYNSILDVLVKEDIDIARGFYRTKMMGCGVKGDMYTFGILMKGLCLTNRISDGFKLLQTMKNKGDTPNNVVYNTLIHALCTNGKLGIGRARSLMNEMVDPNSVTFNILITAYCKEENLVQALVMLEKCFNLGFAPDVITITKLIDLLFTKDRAIEAVEVLERAEKKGGHIDVVAYNTLIKGFCKIKKTKAARRFLKEMELKGCLPNADTYNTLISGFCDLGLLDSALDMFDEMKTVGINWNFHTFDMLVRGLCLGGRIEDSYKIIEIMEETRSGSLGHISPYNSIIYGLYKTSQVDEAIGFLTKMVTKFPRAVDRSTQILEFCEKGRIDNAVKVYGQMILEGGIPSILVYITLIRGLCQENMVGNALEITDQMLASGAVFHDTSTLNALINALCKESKIGNALNFLEDMVGRGCLTDSGSYVPLICAYCKRGDIHKGLMLLKEMVERGHAPNHVAWSSVVQCLAVESMWLNDEKLCFLDDLLDGILKP